MCARRVGSLGSVMRPGWLVHSGDQTPVRSRVVRDRRIRLGGCEKRLSESFLQGRETPSSSGDEPGSLESPVQIEGGGQVRRPPCPARRVGKIGLEEETVGREHAVADRVYDKENSPAEDILALAHELLAAHAKRRKVKGLTAGGDGPSGRFAGHPGGKRAGSSFSR